MPLAIGISKSQFLRFNSLATVHAAAGGNRAAATGRFWPKTARRQ